jgi:hypothetical protein
MISGSVLGGNLSQTLFNQNMKNIKNSNAKLQNLQSLNELNSVNDENEGMKELLPAYIQQANLSTWYQNNPWPILTDSNKYGVETMGGELDLSQPPGYKPGNVLRRQSNVESTVESTTEQNNTVEEATIIPTTGPKISESNIGIIIGAGIMIFIIIILLSRMLNE